MPEMPRILVVDDNQDSREVVKALIAAAHSGYQIDLAADADEAISSIGERSYDLFVLDYMMPEMSGVELCRWIRLANRRVPVLFLSALAGPMHKLIAMEAGATEYLTKPDGLEQLAEAVPRLIEESRQR